MPIILICFRWEPASGLSSSLSLSYSIPEPRKLIFDHKRWLDMEMIYGALTPQILWTTTREMSIGTGSVSLIQFIHHHPVRIAFALSLSMRGTKPEQPVLPWWTGGLREMTVWSARDNHVQSAHFNLVHLDKIFLLWFSYHSTIIRARLSLGSDRYSVVDRRALCVDYP